MENFTRVEMLLSALLAVNVLGFVAVFYQVSQPPRIYDTISVENGSARPLHVWLENKQIDVRVRP